MLTNITNPKNKNRIAMIDFRFFIKLFLVMRIYKFVFRNKTNI